AHDLERALGATDQAHAVVDAAGSQPSLGDLEAAALPEQPVRGGNADAVIDDLRVTSRMPVIVGGTQVAMAPDSGSVGRHEAHRLLAVHVGVIGSGLAPDDQQLAGGVQGALHTPLVTVDDVDVAIKPDLALNVSGVAGGLGRLGHR